MVFQKLVDVPDTDAESIALLIRKIKSDDQDAFREFYFLTQPGIYRFLYRFLSSKESAEDISQEVYLNFWTHRDQLDPESYPKAYLYKIARNLALNFIKRNHYDKDRQTLKIWKPFLGTTPEEEYDKNYFFDEFQRAINDLPERCRATFILCKYEGFEYSEIAEIMSVSLQTVKNQMNKAIVTLRKRLSSHIL